MIVLWVCLIKTCRIITVCVLLSEVCVLIIFFSPLWAVHRESRQSQWFHMFHAIEKQNQQQWALFPFTGGQCGVIRACYYGRAVPTGVGPKCIRHQPEGRGFTQALAFHVCRDGERLCLGDEGPSDLPPSQPGKALWDQVKRTKGSLLGNIHAHVDRAFLGIFVL